MDAKITKKRLGEFLSYEWIKVVAIALAIILFWSLLFSVTGTKLTNDQLFTIINYTGSRTGDDFGTYTSASGLVSQNVFSYEVNEVSVTDLTVEDGSMSGTLLESRLTTGEGDILFAANIENKSGSRVKVDEFGVPVVADNGEYELTTSTYLYDFLSSRYNQCVMPIEDVIVYPDTPYERPVKGITTVVREYLDKYFDYVGGKFLAESLDEAKAEKDFRNRVSETKDKRFRTSALLDAGVKQEFDRLQRYAEAYNQFMYYIEEGVFQVTESVLDFPLDNEELIFFKGKYSLNICPEGSDMDDVKEVVYYYDYTGLPEDYTGEPPHTARDMNVVFLHLEGSREEYVGERLLYVNYLAQKYCKKTL